MQTLTKTLDIPTKRRSGNSRESSKSRDNKRKVVKKTFGVSIKRVISPPTILQRFSYISQTYHLLWQNHVTSCYLHEERERHRGRTKFMTISRSLGLFSWKIDSKSVIAIQNEAKSILRMQKFSRTIIFSHCIQ